MVRQLDPANWTSTHPGLFQQRCSRNSTRPGKRGTSARPLQAGNCVLRRWRSRLRGGRISPPLAGARHRGVSRGWRAPHRPKPDARIAARSARSGTGSCSRTFRGASADSRSSAGDGPARLSAGSDGVPPGIARFAKPRHRLGPRNTRTRPKGPSRPLGQSPGRTIN